MQESYKSDFINLNLLIIACCVVLRGMFFFLHSSLSSSKFSSAVLVHGTDEFMSPPSPIFASVKLPKLQGLFKQTLILQKYLTSEDAPVDLTSSHQQFLESS